MSEPDDLGQLMHRAIDPVRPDVTGLLSGGIERGQARQRRARLRRNLVAVAAPLGVAAAVVALAVAPGGGSQPTSSAGASTTAAETPSATTPTPEHGRPAPTRTGPSTMAATSASPSKPVAGAALVPLSSSGAIQLMVDLLPADGVASKYTGLPNDKPADYVGGTANYVRRGVRADVDVLFSVHARGPFDCTAFIPDFVCSVRHLPDGSTVITARSSAGSAFVQLVKPDGTLIMASEDVTRAEEGATIKPERVDPPMPLTTSELETVVRSGRWQKMVDPALSRMAADKYQVPTRTASAPATSSR